MSACRPEEDEVVVEEGERHGDKGGNPGDPLPQSLAVRVVDVGLDTALVAVDAQRQNELAEGPEEQQAQQKRRQAVPGNDPSGHDATPLVGLVQCTGAELFEFPFRGKQSAKYPAKINSV